MSEPIPSKIMIGGPAPCSLHPKNAVNTDQQPQYGTGRFLDISTRHITEKDNDLLTDDSGEESGGMGYVICWRGEYVQIGLPYQTRGGEKHWVCAPPFKTKVLVNID